MMINFIVTRGSADEWKTWVYVVQKTICLKNNSSSLTSSCLVSSVALSVRTCRSELLLSVSVVSELWSWSSYSFFLEF